MDNNGQLKMKANFDTLEVLAVALAAYEHTNGRIVRAKIEGGPEANRRLITDYIEGRGSPFLVDTKHQEQAQELREYLEHCVVLQSLRGTPDSFLSKISELLSNKETKKYEFGIIAWAPHVADQYRKKDAVREISSRYEYTSNYIGQVSEKIEIDFTMIDRRYVRSTDCYAVYGYSGNNLVFYWAKTLDKVCEVGRIQGRVKSHRKDEYRGNARVTTLNYVKVL